MIVKDDFMKKILIGMFIFLSLFTIAMIVIFILTGDTPDVFIGAVFGACMGEYSICGVIKKAKEKEKTERLKEGYIEDFGCFIEDEDEGEEEVEDIATAIANFECVDEYISPAHDGDIEEEAIE